MLPDETLRHISDDWLDWSRRPADKVPRALVEHCVLTPEVGTPESFEELLDMRL